MRYIGLPFRFIAFLFGFSWQLAFYPDTLKRNSFGNGWATQAWFWVVNGSYDTGRRPC
jgi:hypothetical protein